MARNPKTNRIHRSPQGLCAVTFIASPDRAADSQRLLVEASDQGPVKHGRRSVRRSGRALVVWGRHLDLNLDSISIASLSKVTPGERGRLGGVAGNGDADQVAIADDAVGGIELDPTSAGQVDLTPSVRGAPAQYGRLIAVRNIDIPRHETSRQSERANRLDHEQRQIPATSPPPLERDQGSERSALGAPRIAEALLDCVSEGHEECAG